MPSKSPGYNSARSLVSGDSNARFYQQVKFDSTVLAKTADYTMLVADMGKNMTNTAAAGTVVLSLPAVNTCPNKGFRVQLLAAQIVRVLPVAGEAIYLGGSGVVTKYLNIAAVIGNYADIFCNGTSWGVTGYSGVVTKEP